MQLKSLICVPHDAIEAQLEASCADAQEPRQPAAGEKSPGHGHLLPELQLCHLHLNRKWPVSQSLAITAQNHCAL